MLAAIAVTPLNPLTETGVLRLVFVPSPSCPTEFVPQAFTVPSLFKARLRRTRSDRDHAARGTQTADRHRAGSLRRGSIPNLAHGIVAPRPDRSIALHRQAVSVPGCNANNVTYRRYLDRRAARGRAPDPELPRRIGAPRVHGSATGESHAKSATARYGHHSAQTADLHRARSVGWWCHRLTGHCYSNPKPTPCRHF